MKMRLLIVVVVQLVTLTYVSLSDEVFARDTPTLLHITSLQYLIHYKHLENSQRLQINTRPGYCMTNQPQKLYSISFIGSLTQLLT